MHFLLFLPSFLSLSHLSSPVPSCFILWMDVPKKELMRFSPWLYLDVDSKIEEVWGHSGRGQAATLLGTFGVEDLWFRGWKSDSTSVEDVVKVCNTENVGHEWNQKKKNSLQRHRRETEVRPTNILGFVDVVQLRDGIKELDNDRTRHGIFRYFKFQEELRLFSSVISWVQFRGKQKTKHDSCLPTWAVSTFQYYFL